MSTHFTNGQQSRDIREGYTDFILSRRAMLCSPATVQFYEATVGRFITWLIEHELTDPTQVTAAHIRSFLAEFAERGARGSYIHGHARAVRTFIRFLHDEHYTQDLVKFQMPTIGSQRLPVLSEVQLREVVRACRDARDRAIVLLLADTGLRRSEACALTWGDVDIDSGIVTVARGKGGKARSVVVGANTRRALLRYRRSVKHEEKDPLLQTITGEPLSRMGLRSLLLRLSRRCGIRVSPHVLRRTFATLSLRAGMNPLHLQGLLGHSTLEMTRRYVQMLDEDLRDAHRSHGPIDSFLR